jgi:hypothetical protein
MGSARLRITAAAWSGRWLGGRDSSFRPPRTRRLGRPPGGEGGQLRSTGGDATSPYLLAEAASATRSRLLAWCRACTRSEAAERRAGCGNPARPDPWEPRAAASRPGDPTGRESSRVRGSPGDAAAPFGPRGGGPPRRMHRDVLPDVRAWGAPTSQGAERDPGAGGDVEGLSGEGPTMSVEVASQPAQPSRGRSRVPAALAARRSGSVPAPRPTRGRP